MMRKRSKGGFTLVEILLVVVLLGILATVVMALFRPVSQDSRKAALSETLGRLRAQIQLFTLQHDDSSPDLSVNWNDLITQTTDSQGNSRGPYLPTVPRNSLNSFTGVAIVATDPQFGAAVAGANIGFVYNPNNGFVWGTNTTGTRIYNEGNPDDPNN